MSKLSKYILKRTNKFKFMDYGTYLDKYTIWNEYDFVPNYKIKKWYMAVKHRGYEARCFLWYGSMASIDFGDVEGKAYALWIMKDGKCCLHAGHSKRHTKGQLKKRIDEYIKFLKWRNSLTGGSIKSVYCDECEVKDND